jgi:predicted methyltransferase
MVGKVIEIFVYKFTKNSVPIPGFIISHIRRLNDGQKFENHFDLGIIYKIINNNNNISITLSIGKITKQINLPKSRIEVENIDSSSIYIIDNDIVLTKVETFSEHGYLKLMMTDDMLSPTIVINGIHMHKIINKSPYRDALNKVKLLGNIRNRNILDICTGLGYTAIAALMRGAKKILTIELNSSILRIAEFNPWSYFLESRNITILNNDATKILPLINDNTFDKIIHDPPRFNIAGELYSLDFYKELFRILRPGGTLFHYTGTPMRKRGRGSGPIIRGIKERLQRAGFVVKYYDPIAEGFVAIKPRLYAR